TENFLEIVAGRIPGTDILMRGRGSAFGFTFGRNPDWAAFAGSDLIAYSLNPARLGEPQPVGLPLGATYKAVYQGLAELPLSVLRSFLPPPLNDPNVLPDAQLQGLLALLDPSVTSVTGFSKGALGMLNRATGEINPISDVTDIDPLKRNTTQSFEAGYKGLIEDRVLFAVDVYYTNKKNFVGPLLFESPFVFVPTLLADLRNALANGITNNAQLAAALAAFGLTPEQIAALLVDLAKSNLPDATTPVAIVAPNENAPALGQTPELLLAYRNFGNVNFWGIDASVQVIATDKLSFFGNLSFVSDDFFDNKELDETNTALSVALNAPSFKTKFGFSYSVPLGISVNASGRYIKGFPVDSGVYKGDVENYFLLDIGAGYDLGRYAPGMRFDIAVQNVLDNDHREFIGAPKIGRFAMARLSYSIR
ncbi:MAG: TonB-dependent receptor domain-containing protein, partial [bacterium]